MIDLNAILQRLGLDNSKANPDDLAIIIKALEQEIRDIVSGPFYWSEATSLIETLVQIYSKWGSMKREELAETVEVVFGVLDSTYHIIDYLDTLVPADKVPFVGALAEQMDGPVIRWVLFKLVLPAAIKLLNKEN